MVAHGELSIKNLLNKYGFFRPGTRLRSVHDVTTLSTIPNILSKPRVSNMGKKRTAQTCGAGNWLMASVNAINTSPVPEAD